MITLAEYDPRWPELFEVEAARIRGALGGRALRVEHAGSTAVPGLMAKPVIDLVLEVAESAAEGEYLPEMERAGYRFVLREPEWFEHRLFKGSAPAVNLHVFSQGCEETGRMLRFRDRLRANAEDRERYQAVKLVLAQREWATVNEYAAAKTEVVREISARAESKAV